jgi:hypothetical protein
VGPINRPIAKAWRGCARLVTATTIFVILGFAPAASASAAAVSWHVVPSPTTANDVTCVAANDCWAVGSSIMHNVGAGWVTVSSPTPTGSINSHLDGVTCVSNTDCWAAGGYLAPPYNELTLVEHYDGVNWSIVSSPSPDPNNSQFLNIRCTNATNCWAVGMTVTTAGDEYPLIEQYTQSSWVVASNPSGTNRGALRDVACLNATGVCWAVGWLDNPANQPLVEYNPGTGWVVIPSPAASTGQLYGVTCMSATNCWAVGSFDSSARSTTSTFTERYDGSRWSIVPSPNVGSRHPNWLNDVSCTSASDCWAVGSDGISDQKTLIEHFAGGRWRTVASPTGASSGSLVGIKCVARFDCWAVGDDNPILQYT